MSEALIGVLIGGLIASIAPLSHLYIDHRRWKLEKRIELLRIERKHYEDLYNALLPEITKALATRSWSVDAAATTLALAPRKVVAELFAYLGEDEKTKTEQRRSDVLFVTTKEMKGHLRELDDAIREVIDGA